MKTAESMEKRSRPYLKTGVFGLKRALKRRGLKALDGRSSIARGIAAWRADVEADLGGELSRAEGTVLDMAAAGVVLLGQIDAWIGTHPELIVNTRKRSVAPIVRERIAVAEHAAGLLKVLGLKRKARELSFEQRVALKHGGAVGEANADRKDGEPSRSSDVAPAGDGDTA